MKNFWSAALLLITIAVGAQTYRLQGLVLDLHNHMPLANAHVYRQGVLLTTTDAQGKFNLEKLRGTMKISILHPECDALHQTILIDSDKSMTFYMEHHEELLETVTIKGKTPASPTAAVQSLKRKEVEQNASENLGNLLSGISGVGTMKTGNNIAKPIINGLYGSRVLVVNNGVRLAEQEWGVEHAPSVDANAFETINVVKGAGTLRYGGDAIGGVVMLETKLFAAKDTLSGNIRSTYNTNGRGGSLVAEIYKTWENRWFVRTQGSFKKMGDLSTPDFTLQNTGAGEHALNFGAGYRAVEKGIEFYYSGITQEFGIFKGSHLGSAEDFINALNGRQTLYTGDFSYDIDNPKQNVSHHLAKMDAYYRFPELGKVSVQYAFQLNRRKEYDIRRGEYNDLPSMDLRLATHTLKLENVHEHEHWTLQTGVNAGLQDHYPNPATKARRLIPDYYRYDAGLFTVFEYRFNPKLHAELGARYDFTRYDAYKYYDESDWEARFADLFNKFFIQSSGSRVLTRPQMDFSNWSGNLGLAYNPASQFNVKFNLSRAQRTPNPAELFADGLHHSAAIIERGNLAIKSETVYQAALTAKLTASVLSGAQLEVHPYFMTSDNFINQNPTGALITIRGIFPVWDYQQINAQLYGLDADLQVNLTPELQWKSQFSTVRGNDLTNDEPLIMMVPTNFRNTLEFSVPAWREASMKVENLTFLRQKHYPQRHVPVAVIENGQNVEKILDLSTPPPGYSIWNISAGLNLYKNLRADFGLTNAANTRYREYLNRLRYFADAMGRNFYLTLNYKF